MYTCTVHTFQVRGSAHIFFVWRSHPISAVGGSGPWWMSNRCPSPSVSTSQQSCSGSGNYWQPSKTAAGMKEATTIHVTTTNMYRQSDTTATINFISSRNFVWRPFESGYYLRAPFIKLSGVGIQHSQQISSLTPSQMFKRMRWVGGEQTCARRQLIHYTMLSDRAYSMSSYIVHINILAIYVH